MLQPPTLPLSVRALNATLSAATRLGLQSSTLDPDKLIDAACEKTGLTDFDDGTGDRQWQEGFERLVADLNRNARLSPLGRQIATQELTNALANRLLVNDYHARHPEVTAASIEKPIFVIGMGRTGTTIMHELLALDTQLRCPQTWEVDAPFPPPETATYRTDPRIAAADKQLQRTDLVLPQFKSIHRMGATLPQECVRFTTCEFLSLIFWTEFNVPEYNEWLLHSADMQPAYHFHKRFLQVLQHKHPANPWVLKSPGHLWSLDQLLEQYPDARFIQTHRDPLRILASLTSLVTHLRKMSSDHVDGAQIAREWAQWNALGLNNSARFRQEGKIKPENVIDVSFYDFIDAPIRQIEKIYDKFDLPLSDSTRSAMQAYVTENSQQQHGGHKYTFADTGLNAEAERARVAPYQAYFNVQTEQL